MEAAEVPVRGDGQVKKVTVTLNPRQEDRLRHVSESLHTSQAEVIRRAINLFHKIMLETESGEAAVQVVDKDGTVRKEFLLT